MMQSNVGLRSEPERELNPTIGRLPTARTAFVGRTLRGPVNRPVFLKSFAEFQLIFGGLWQPSPLCYAVEQFFDNGGREAIVVRVVNGARAATLTLAAGGGSLTLRAVRPGTREFLRACVDYDNIAAGNLREFNLTVQRVRLQGTEQVEDQEIFRRVSVLPDAERYVSRLLAESELVGVIGQIPAVRPDLTLDPASGLAIRYVCSNADGDDGAPVTDYDLIGSASDKTGMFALDQGESFNLLCLPPLSRSQDVGLCTLLVAVRYCKARRALLIVDPPAGWHTAEEALSGMRQWEFACEDAVMYFPRILAHDKLRGHFESFAPCGAVAGMLARADESRPVWGPAQHEDAVLRPGFRPACLVPEDSRKRLATMGVNTIQAVRSAARSGGELRTLAAGAAGAADWQSLTLRRQALFILNCIERGTRWVVNAPRDGSVAAVVGAQVRAFFERLYAAGSFGDRPMEEAFFVICDERMNPVADAPPGEFQLLIGFAATRRHEFHSFRIAHTAAGSRVTPASLNRLNDVQFSAEEIEWVDALAVQLMVGQAPTAP
jgi:phage tail sheath protein FI